MSDDAWRTPDAPDLPRDLQRILGEARRRFPRVAWSLEERDGEPWLRIEAWDSALPGGGLRAELERFCKREGLAPRFEVVAPRLTVAPPPGVRPEDVPPPRPVTDEQVELVLAEAQRLRPRGGFTWQVMRKGAFASLVLYFPPGSSAPRRWLRERLDEFCDREGIPRLVLFVGSPPPPLRLEDHPVPDGWPPEPDAEPGCDPDAGAGPQTGTGSRG